MALLEDKATEIGSNYWQRLNFDNLLHLQLPLEKLKTACNHFEPQVIDLSIKSDRLQEITNLTTEDRTSTASFLLTCWQILFYRLTNQSDLVIGVSSDGRIGISSDGRKYAELESAIGLIAKYLPIQNHLEDNITTRELCQKNFNLHHEATQREEYFSWDDNSAFFSVVFEYNQDFPVSNSDLLSLTIDRLYSCIDLTIDRLYSCIDRFKIKLACQEKDDTLNLIFYYDTNLFLRSDIQHLAKQFDTLVTSILDNPNIAISHLEILDESEKQQILTDFNNTKIDFPPLRNIQQKFERQVAKTPNAIALIYGEKQLTYQQLNQRTNQLAYYLRKQGIVAEDLVAIYLEPSLEAIIGLLGVLKAGAAYVPLDPNLPSARLGWMLEDTQVKVILTQQQLASSLPESTASIICLDSQWSTIQPESDENLDCISKPENLAYIIYTSGSTGKPKGVAIEHRQILNYLHSIVKDRTSANP